jgi:hypothetical protein
LRLLETANTVLVALTQTFPRGCLTPCEQRGTL